MPAERPGKREPDRPRDRGHDPSDLIRRDRVGDGRPKLLEGRIDAIVVADPGESARYLGKRKVRDAVAVRHAPAHDDTRSGEAVDELRYEAALSHAGVSEDRDELRALLAYDARRCKPKQCDLVGATDQRSCVLEPARPARRHGIDRVPRFDR